MAKLIALAAIAAATYGPDQPAIAKGEVFEAPLTQELIDKLLEDKVAELAPDTAGDAAAKPPKPADKAVKSTKVRLLVDSVHGKVNEVVSLPADVAKTAIDDGMADASKASIDYALSLAKPAAEE